MVSLDDVIKFMQHEKVEAGPLTEDVASCALMMAKEYASSENRVVTINDVRLALSWLCWFPFPGKPPQRRKVTEAVASLCRYARVRGVAPVVMPSFPESVPAQMMTPLSLEVKVDEIAHMGIDVTGIPKKTVVIAGRPTTIASLSNVIDRITPRYRTL